MVAMHMGDDHHVDLIGGVTRLSDGGGGAFGVQAGVEQDKLIAGIDQRGGKEELGRVGRDMGGF
jgi:hypothetical protein